jgi:hypothetical protein
MPDRAYEGCSIATQTAPAPTPIAERAVGAVGMPAQATRGVSLTNDPHSTAAWAQGSRGERLVGEHPEKIQDAMTGEFKVEVRAALCFVDAEWSPFAKPFDLGGVWIGWPKALGERIRQQGGLTPEHIGILARAVASALPPA